MDFKTYAKKKKNLIEVNLSAFTNKKNSSDLPESIRKLKILENLTEFSLRGKMLRGILFLFGCEMFGKKISKKEIDIACAIELVHSALLIHDDIIDNDFFRRGEKTIFSKYIEHGQEIKANDTIHYGKSMGIVAGDTAFFLATELLSNYDKNYLKSVLKFYTNEIFQVSLAEGLDSQLGQSNKEATVDEIKTVYRFKTARYTFSLPLMLAGLVCNANNKTLKLLENLGEKAGLVFQIKDDELGLFGNLKEIGKPVGSDVRENKKTLIRDFLFQSVNTSERQKLDKIFGNPKLNKSDLEYVLKLSDKYKIKEKNLREIKSLMEDVWKEFNRLEIDANYKTILKELLEYNVSRNS